MCLYHVDVASQPGGQVGIIMDIATSTTMTFPSTSTVVIGVDDGLFSFFILGRLFSVQSYQQCLHLIYLGHFLRILFLTD